MKQIHSFLLFCVFIFSSCAFSHAATRLPEVAPEEAGMNPGMLQFIDRAVERALEEKAAPGAVVAVGRSGKLVYLKAFGKKRLVPQEEPMEVDTVFDLASLTKPISTASSVMILVEQGKVDLNEKVSTYLPDFAANGKEDITVRQLMIHTAGLIADTHLSEYEHGLEKSIESFVQSKPVAKAEERFIYSDVGFQVLGELVRKVSGKNIHEFSRDNIFVPLGMEETTYVPGEEIRKRCAPTQDREPGEVHDPRAFRTEGIAGHAGLFSSARDLAVYADTMLNFGNSKAAQKRILKEETVRRMVASYPVPGNDPTGLRGLGWDKRSGYSSNRGWNMSPQAFGHGGFTGTAIWIDPGMDLFVIFLSNRVHPDGKGSVNSLAGRIGTIAVDSILRGNQVPKISETAKVNKEKRKPVLCGIDVLKRDGFEILKGQKVGLISNHTGLDYEGNPTPKLLQDAPGVDLVCLFSPEHGFTGTWDEDGIKDSTEASTGLKVYSLYGATRRPSPGMLEKIDTLVFDMSDIGARFYTYISTMGASMQAAAENGKRFVVLDRPNPIGGTLFDGGQMDPGTEAFIAFHPMCIQHGMSIGELALMFNDELNLNLDLVVVPVEGWKRGDFFEETGTPWVNPSPNMKTVDAAITYPGLCLIEFTNLSVGRGTETPFEMVGAPWIDGEKLAKDLNARKLEGVRFEAVKFTPPVRQYTGEECNGIKIVIEDRNAFRPVRFGLNLIEILMRDYKDQWERKNLNTLLLHREARDMFESGKSAQEVEKLWEKEIENFQKRRARYLIYQ